MVLTNNIDMLANFFFTVSNNSYSDLIAFCFK